MKWRNLPLRYAPDIFGIYDVADKYANARKYLRLSFY
jgi:hypothetical protein